MATLRRMSQNGEEANVTTHETSHTDESGASSAAWLPSRMCAIVMLRYGVPDVLQVAEVEVPAPGPGQVLIRVEAASMNVYDWHMVSGTPLMVRAVAGLSKPKNSIPGADVAGVVAAVGDGVSRLRIGDEVFGEIGAGAFAEYAVSKEMSVAHKPAGVSFQQAAAMPMAGLTALQGLRDVGGLLAGQRVVVNGASGGVGTYAVQIAKALGADVTAVCSTAKVATARSIGADHVIDYTAEDYTLLVQDCDVLFDNAGDRPWRETSRVLAPGGINVTVTGPKHRWFGPLRNLLARKAAAAFGDKRLAWFTANVNREDLELLATLLTSGQVVPVIERTYPLAETPQALRYLAEGHAHGKLVITV